MDNIFFEDTTDDLEYKYKILVWPNWTFSNNLNADSFTIVIENVINVLPKNIYWTIPYHDTKLSKGNKGIAQLNKFDNVELVKYDFPTYPNTMRCDFNTSAFKKLIDWERNDWDIIYSHLPEHTSQISNVLHNDTNITPKIVGYCHWYEVNENTAYDKRLINQNLLGTLEMDECGVNTAWLRDLVIDKTSDVFNEDAAKRFKDIIQPHYLGIDNYDFNWSKKTPNSILFNHRPNDYTGWKKFLTVMDEIYKERQDFTVYGTLVNEERPYIKKVSFPEREDYLDFLKEMTVGICFFQTYSAWSISATDGMSRGVPYLMPNKLCYPEMVGEDYPLFYNDNDHFKELLNGILDNNKNPTITKAVKHVKKIIPDMTWDKQVAKWFNGWDIFDLKQIKSETDAYKKIRQFILDEKIVTKKRILDYMNWGINIKFSQYRNRLRNEPNIKFTKNKYIATD